MTRPIKSVVYLGDKQLDSSVPLYLKDKLIERMYLGEYVVYRITKQKAKQ